MLKNAFPSHAIVVGSLAAALLASGARAQDAAACPPPPVTPTAAQLEQAAKTAKDRGFLWKATKDGRTSYLYGTIHLGRLDWAFPGPKIRAGLTSSEVVAFELDLLDPDIAKRLQAEIAPKPNRKLAEKTRDRLRAQIRAVCLPEGIMDQMAPEMLATTLSMIAARREGLDPSFGADATLIAIARQLGKKVSSLETPEAQARLLTGGTVQEMEAIVTSAVEELESGKALPMLMRLANAWVEGRLAELESYEKWCDCLETEMDRAMMKRLLDDRNPGLANGIDAIHASGKSVFAAVGSLHMTGPLGIPALLAKRGYKVERIDLKPISAS